MKKFLVILLMAGAAAGFVRQGRIAELREVIEAGKASMRALERGRSAREAGPAVELTAEQAAQMRAERMELMRLRAGMAELRTAAQSPEKIEEEISKLNDAAAHEEMRAKELQTHYETEQRSKASDGMLRHLSNLVQTSARLNGGKIVRSFDELKSALSASGRIPNIDMMWDGLRKGYPPYHVTLDQFEFLPEAATKNGILVMREREPRQLADGSWARLYFTTDFQVNELKLKDGDFAGWERQHF